MNYHLKNAARQRGKRGTSRHAYREARHRRSLLGGAFGKASPRERIALAVGCGSAESFLVRAEHDLEQEKLRQKDDLLQLAQEAADV